MNEPKADPGRVFSAAPPSAGRDSQRDLIVAGGIPGTAGATRGRHFKRILFSRDYIVRFTFIAGGLFLLAAATGNTRAALIAPLVAAAITLALAFNSAHRHSVYDFYEGFARAHGFSYTRNKIELLAVTPLLGAGDRRCCEHYMEGPLSEDAAAMEAGLALYTYETRSDRSDRRGRVVEAWTPHRYTVCVVQFDDTVMTAFPGVFLTQRRGLLGRFASDQWLDYGDLRPFELESSQLANNYELVMRPDQHRARLLELFQPSFQVWLAELPLDLCFELSGGTLVVYTNKRLTEAGSLEILLQATATIAERVLRESRPMRPKIVPPPGPPSVPPPSN
jgi:hypothetical protein